MTDTTDTNEPQAAEPNDPTQTSRKPPKRRRWLRRVLLFGALPAAALSGFVATRAFAGGFGPGCHRRGHGGEATLDEAREHLWWMAGFALDRLDATDSQKGQIHEILDRAAAELMGYRQEGRALRDDLRDALAKPTVDAAELERVRTDFVDSVDRASRVLATYSQQIAGVLTLPQRQKLVEAWRARRP